MQFDGLNMNLGNLPLLSNAQTCSISAENPTGEKGKGALAEPDANHPARELGRGWKVRPYIVIAPGETAVLAEIDGPGAIQSTWFGGTIVNRDFILRVYWDEEETPSIEAPLPDFFASPWSHQRPGASSGTTYAPVNSLPVCVNPNRGLNCFWPMPFRGKCRITLENLNPQIAGACYYQINYALMDVPEDCAYFHAQFRRRNPLPYQEEYVILDGVSGCGHYVGTSMGWGINNDGWWGEGEIKLFMDGDTEFPTICGTGTEDYFGGAYNWDVNGQYTTYTTPFMGMHQVVKPNGLYNSQHRHAMYRWHVMDPIRFQSGLRVQIQALGWRSEGRFLPGQHDISSVAFWYQTLPAAPFPTFPDRNALEIAQWGF